MKAVHLVSILLVATASTFACSDDDSTGPLAEAGTSSGGSEGGKAGSGGKAGKAGSSNGGSNSAAGKAGAPSGGSGDAGDGGLGGAAGGMPQLEGGAAGFGGVGMAGEGMGGEAGMAGMAGAAGAGGETSQAPLEIIGTWDTNFGGTDVITATHWGEATIAAYDNDDNAVYTQLPADDQWNPNKFTKIVYTEPANDSFYYCWVVFSALTLAEAQNTSQTADASNPDTSGCGGFPWTKVTKHP